MPAGLEDRHVLIHDGNVDVVAEALMEPREAFAAVAPLPGKHQMPHDHAALHETVLADDGRPRHAEHRFDRFGSVFEIVRDARILFSESAVEILEIRNEDIDEAVEHS